MVSSFIGLGVVLKSRPLLFAHVMPWFSAHEKELGWHWKMNKSTEEVRKSGKVASHYRPLIGPYDSNDPSTVELQVLWMKVAGFDGVIADWYGTEPHYDYPMIHERTKSLFKACDQFGLGISVVYEDQTVKNAINGKLIPESESLKIATRTGEFLKSQWLAKPNWLKVNGKPAVLVFGPQHFKGTEWTAFKEATGPISFLTLHKSHSFSDGGYDWPIPSLGLKFTREFGDRSLAWKSRVPVVFPRFHDYYVQGGNPSGYPELPDRSGGTFVETLEMAAEMNPSVIQFATWNDWQEGTQIEPSVEFGYRDLKVVQAYRRRVDRSFGFREADFELPLKLFRSRKRGSDRTKLDSISMLISHGKTVEAAARLNELS
jgi:hypothetical protein